MTSRSSLFLSLVVSVLSTGCYCSHELEDRDGSAADSAVIAADATLPRVDGATVGDGALAVGVDIRDVAADAERVYWIEYGTTEITGRHRGDGVLRARRYDGGEARTLVTGLEGPRLVAVTSAHAFVWLDAHRRADGTMGWSVVRASLTDGAIDVVVEDATQLQRCFAADGDRAFWSMGTDIYSMRASDGEPVVFVPDVNTTACAIDGDHLYFDGEEELLRAPLAGGPAERRTALIDERFSMHEGRVVTVVQDPMTGVMHVVELEEDGAVRQMLTLDLGSSFERVEVVSGLFGTQIDDPGSHVYGGSLSAGGDAHAAVSLPERFAVVAWTGSPRGVVWTDGTTVTLDAR